MIQTTPVHVVEGHDETASGLSSACPPGILIHWNTIHVPLVDSVLVLYRSYPGDPGLQDYLKAAIQDGILPVSTFVSTLLQAARSPELHIPATLDTLCRIALDFHYSSGQPPLGSVVPASASVTVILEMRWPWSAQLILYLSLIFISSLLPHLSSSSCF